MAKTTQLHEVEISVRGQVWADGPGIARAVLYREVEAALDIYARLGSLCVMWQEDVKWFGATDPEDDD